MALSSQSEIDALLATIPSQVRGAGGAVAVVKDGGEVVSQRVWGYAKLQRGIPMQSTTQLPICSISKHMLCLVIADLEKRPTAAMKKQAKDVWTLLDEELRALMPQLFQPSVNDSGRQLTVPDLFNMQSGIRDYWAMTVLWGARAEDPFSLLHDAPKTLDRTKSFHFPPGTEFSYSNVNFHILGRLVENVSGRSLGQLLAERVFIPAGMKTAALTPNSMGLPLPIVGYEGDERGGYVPAVNGIEWQGDAGVTASLEDMVAYERYLQRSWGDQGSNYRAIAARSSFNDGGRATYSHGLLHTETGGEEVISHTGGLRGFRLRRLHVPAKKISVVVMMNHQADPVGTSELVLRPLLGVPVEEEASDTPPTESEEWEGTFFDEDQQRVITASLPVEKSDAGKILINYGGGAKPEKLKLLDAKSAESASMRASVEENTLHLIRDGDGVDILCRRLATTTTSSSSSADYTGTYHSPSCESTLTLFPASPSPSSPSQHNTSTTSGETLLYASFTGFLGTGPIHLLRYVARDIWILTCPRSMDAPAPGEWTMVFQRDREGRVEGVRVRVGCWLARKVEFGRV